MIVLNKIIISFYEHFQYVIRNFEYTFKMRHFYVISRFDYTFLLIKKSFNLIDLFIFVIYMFSCWH